MLIKTTLKSREEWLEERAHSIGGSEAAAVIGISPWMSNTELWDIKAGKIVRGSISENPLVMYGTKAEHCLRELFALDFPDQKVMYEENNLFRNTDMPWAHASLDGWLEDEDGRKGVLEIKTANIMSGAQMLKWEDRIPAHYYAQVVHEMAVTEADYAVVKAQLKRDFRGDIRIDTRHYIIDREDVERDIENLMEAERTFWQSLQENRKPARILPEI